MTHAKFETLLLLRASGELEPAPAKELAEHIPTCPACRAFAAGLGPVSQAAGLSLENPPAALVRKIRAKILSGRRSPAFSMPWNWVPAGLGMALATLLLMVSRLPEPGVSTDVRGPLDLGSGVPLPPTIGSGLPRPGQGPGIATPVLGDTAQVVSPADPAQAWEELAVAESDLDELEALASEPDWDLTENVTGGDL